ncbi:DUF2334 domain-containing protein [Carboxylicivirga linearis]|uniref:DUF2334 domain-containing protein n=1 Tax=Carboxylicivirga linearis TaxID=1628157 RepID=A0ABS5JW11_9BACT|nr:DUF2334 domain-containing protein [Carboxylicivirga linearis]MBS2099085.1 DUF2334 domain-containing protein [Carboxylicivirga linearis]
MRLKVHILIVSLLSIALFSLKASECKVKIIFRYDDYSSDSDTKLEEQLFKLFKENDIPLVVGVIPFHKSEEDFMEADSSKGLSDDKTELLDRYIKYGIVEVGLHGFSHFNNSIDINNKSEFKGLHYSKQHQLISSGKTYLDSVFNIDCRTFIPPWNSYDSTTVKVLKELDFKIVSSNINHDFSFNDDSILFMPYQSDIDEVDSYLVNAESLQANTQKYIVVLFHSYDFQSNDSCRSVIQIETLDKLLKHLHNLEGVSFTTFNEVYETISDNSSFSKSHIWRKKLNKKLPSFYNIENTSLLMEWKIYRTSIFLKFLSWYLLMLFAGILSGIVVIRILKFKLVLFFVLSVIILLVVINVNISETYYKIWSLLLVCIGMWGSVLFNIMRENYKFR